MRDNIIMSNLELIKSNSDEFTEKINILQDKIQKKKVNMKINLTL